MNFKELYSFLSSHRIGMKSIPNIITLSRIFLSLSTLIIFFSSYNISMLLFIIVSVAALSDKLDGYLAKKYNSITMIGKVLDPLADKILAFAVMFIFWALGLLPLWGAIVIVLKDAALCSYRLIKLKQGIVVPSLKLGRYKTAYNFFVFEITFLLMALYGTGSIANGKFSFIKYLILTTIL